MLSFKWDGGLGIFAKGEYCRRFAAVIRGCSAIAGNNKLIPGWPINSLAGHAIHEWHMPVRNTLKDPIFVNGIGGIREFNLFVGGLEHIFNRK
jgi:hypothetical protein